jgi:hypothetical protein
VSVAPGSTCTYQLTLAANLNNAANGADDAADQVIDVPTDYAEATITWTGIASNAFGNQQLDLVCLQVRGV